MPGVGARARARDVFFYDRRDPCILLGGLVRTNGITNANFYAMVDIVLVVSTGYLIQDDDGAELPRDSEPLRPGNYFIVAKGTVEVTDKIALLRTKSPQTGTRVRQFTDMVRQRDRCCVISKRENVAARFGNWDSFQAAHIFPLAYEGYWKQHSFGRWITIPGGRGGLINSVQNGILLEASLHIPFDTFNLSVNPDDNHKIVCFQPDSHGVAGTFLDRRLLDDPRRPVDELWRWHFRQAVLTNMRGAGEPTFEHDFPPGSDILGDIRDGPRAGERMEFELFNRLGAQLALNEEITEEERSARDRTPFD